MPVIQADLSATLTTTDIALRRGCHPSAPVRWIQQGAMLSDGRRLKLRATCLPGSRRVCRDDLERFLDLLTRDRQRDSVASDADEHDSQ
jgi:hypothetical protein